MSTRRKSAWSEWDWHEDRNQWGRYRISRGKHEYEWQDPEPSTSKLEEGTTTDWSEWDWHEDRNQWGRYRIFRGKYEYEWQDPEPSTSSTSKAGAKKDKGKEKNKEKGNLSVALYRPRWGNLRHWALYLDTGNWVYEVTGEAMHFTAEVKNGVIPNNSGSWIESIHVAEIQAADMPELHRIITETPVQNDVQGWCCQDYVMEALEYLNEEQIVDDEDFEKAKRRLMKKFNN
jgi:hypothetical protein